MANNIKILIVLILILSLQSCSIFNNNNGKLVGVGYDTKYFTKDIYKEVPKKARWSFEDMRFIPSSSRTIPSYFNPIVNKNDSTLLKYYYGSYNSYSRVVTEAPFYICDHEVTNAEYLEFVYWVLNYTERTILAKYYPEVFLNEKKVLIRNKPINNDIYTKILNDELYYTEAMMYKTKSRISVFDSIQTDKLIYNFKTIEQLSGKRRSMIIVDKNVSVFPNNLCWIQEFPNLENADAMSLYYLTHPAYANYPVVGVSWEQAMAYCAWRSDLLNEAILLEKGIDIGDGYFSLIDFLESDTLRTENDPIYDFIFPNFTLPTINEWQTAATINSFDNEFPWNAKGLMDENGRYLANFGKIVDVNGYVVKDYKENSIKDGWFTSEVRYYPPNDFELYDMAGNVAEWTASKAYDMPSNYDLNPTTYLENDTLNFNRYVKGGSWADGPVYLRWQTNTQVDSRKSSSRIGFRVAMPIKYNETSNSNFFNL